MKAILYSVALLICASHGYSQDADSILQKSNATMQSLTFSANVVYESYSSHTATTSEETVHVNFKQFKNGYSQAYEDIYILQEDSLSMTINKNMEEVSLSRVSDFTPTDLIKLSDFESEVISSSVIESNRSYEVHIAFSKAYIEVEKMVISIDKESFHPRSMLFLFGNQTDEGFKRKMKVSFENIQTGLVRSSDEHIKHYVKIENNRLITQLKDLTNYHTRLNL